MPDIRELEQLKRHKEALEKEKSRAQGRYEVVLAELEKQYGCKNIAEAEELLKQLEKEEKKKRLEADAALSEFKRQYGNE